jgi:hypothetical protein
MLLKLAALLAALSHTIHDTIHELNTDAAEHQRGATQVQLSRAKAAYNKRVAAAYSGSARRSIQAAKHERAAVNAAGNRDKAQAVIDLVKS